MSTSTAGTDAGMASAPKPAWAYGLAGLIPFIACAAAAWAVQPIFFRLAITAEVAYGAVILGFLGAAHWGLALAGQGTAGDSRAASTWLRLGFAVAPAVVGWAAVLLALQPAYQASALILQIAAFAALWYVDLRVTRLGLLPQWYPGLRLVLTAVAIAALVVSLARVLVA